MMQGILCAVHLVAFVSYNMSSEDTFRLLRDAEI